MKDNLKHILIGVPMMWLFVVLAGVGLYYFEEYPIAWLLLIFVVTPIAVLLRNYFMDRKRKKDA